MPRIRCIQCESESIPGDCYLCHGTGSIKEIDPHPDPDDVEDDGSVPCTECGGDRKCPNCEGTGFVWEDGDGDDED